MTGDRRPRHPARPRSLAVAALLLALTVAGSSAAPANAAARLAPPVASAGAPQVADPGNPSQQQPIDLDELQLSPTPSWGVVGIGQTVEEPRPHVWDFEQIGDRLYVAGAFTGVTSGANAPVISQPYLAAFDVNSGVFIDSFRPAINRAVYALETAPNGNLLVGGEFSIVNGETRNGLVALNPTTGTTDPRFNSGIGMINSPETRRVRELVVDGLDVYVVGRFNQIYVDAPGSPYFVWSAVRLRADSGLLDPSWVPQVNGGVWDIAVDRERDRVHLAGYFGSVAATPGTGYMATVQRSNGALVPGLVPFALNDPSEIWTHSVAVSNDRIYVGGADHIIQVLDANTNAVIGWNSTGRTCTSLGRTVCVVPPFDSGKGFQVTGGDFQVIEVTDDTVIGGCHCFADIGPNAEWRDKVHYSSFSGQFTAHNTAIGYRSSDSTVIAPFIPALAPGFWGTWALETDSNGCLWIGGDYTSTDSGAWVGGMARFCEAPTAVASSPARFVAQGPTRLVDTREPWSTPNVKLAADQMVTVTLRGLAGIPANATAVALNVTATEASATGFVSITPSGVTPGTTSSLNLTPGQTVANSVVVPLGPDGGINVLSQGGTHLVIDLAGWFEPASTASAGRIVSLSPQRLFDTREPGSTPTGFVGENGVIRVPAAGRAGVPATGAAAVVLNLTATQAAGPGYVTAWSGDGPAPFASSLNLERPGQTIANMAIVPLGADGSISFLSQAGAHLLADVVGYVTNASNPSATTGLFVPLVPGRVVDTRTGGASPVGAGGSIDVQVVGVANVPDGASAVLTNVTATEVGGPGFVTVWDSGTTQPLASTLNLNAAGETRPNGTIARLGTGGRLSVFTQIPAHLLADVSGYLLS